MLSVPRSSSVARGNDEEDEEDEEEGWGITLITAEQCWDVPTNSAPLAPTPPPAAAAG
jgi:hypothetical protein